jgi:hypothetical protein
MTYVHLDLTGKAVYSSYIPDSSCDYDQKPIAVPDSLTEFLNLIIHAINTKYCLDT